MPVAPASSPPPAQPGGRPGPVLVPPPAREPTQVWVVLGLCAAVFVPRLVVFPFNENTNYGDALVRTELAERWLSAPHWISSFHDGAYQFGPLHIYLVALFLKVWPAREHAGRLLSLVAAVATTVPLYALTRRLFGWRAGVVAGLAFAVWGMHVQFSTTAGSEALSLLLVLTCLALFARALGEGRLGPLAGAAVALNLACATRYDAWLLMPILCGLLLVRDKDRIASVTRAVLFGLMCLAFPLAWMQGNELATGDPFYPMTFIDQFHRSWVGDGFARYGKLGYRLHNLFFWPGAAVVTLTPLVAAFAAVGMRRTYRETPQHRWLLWVVWLPSALFAVKGAVMANFAPLARFAAPQLVLLLPFVATGFEAVTRPVPKWGRRAWIVATALLALGMPSALGLYTFRRDTSLASSLRPVSPTSTNPMDLMGVARFVKAELAPRNEALIVDTDSQYRDLQIAFFGGLPEKRMARYRWEDFPKLLASADPRYLLRMDGGGIERDAGFAHLPTGIRFREHDFVELPGFSAPYHVYRRQ
jgi:4-amino-4-deoxy-L-arabinose transferase-like glycosyltransferase